MNKDLSQVPVPLLILIAAILFAQSTWLFLDARKRNANPWFWGIWGLIHTPMPLIFYFIFVRKIFKKKNKS